MILDRCGCCEGIHPITPVDISNGPGLPRLSFRVGTHGSFLETMKARLSSMILEVPDPTNPEALVTVAPLRTLTAREETDPSIAMFDAWATTADIISFYQERIANEGYLRTATERRSLVELARLVGYVPRPGVASSVYLAFTLQKTTAPPPPPLPGIPNFAVPQPLPTSGTPFPAGGEEDADILVPAGTAAQSIPASGELPQTFETSGPLVGRVRWNALKPRQTRPFTLKDVDDDGFLTLKGTTTSLSPNDPLVVGFADRRKVLRVTKVTSYPAVLPWEGWTVVEAEDWLGAHSSNPGTMAPAGGSTTAAAAGATPALDVLGEILDPLRIEPSAPPPSPRDLDRSTDLSFGENSDLGPRLLTVFHPELRDALYAAWSTSKLSNAPELSVDALRVKASLFGHNAPSRANEQFSITLAASGKFTNHTAAAVAFKLGVTLGDLTKKGIKLKEGSQTIPFEKAQEKLQVNMSLEGSMVTISILFERRLFTVTLTLDLERGPNAIEVTTTGSDPTDFAIGISKEREFEVEVEGTLARSFSLKEQADVISLDASYPKIVPGSLIVVDRVDPKGNRSLLLATAATVNDVSRADYGQSGVSTQITLTSGEDFQLGGSGKHIAFSAKRGWFDAAKDDFSVLRTTKVYAVSEPLPTAEKTIDPELTPVGGAAIELDGLYGGLQSGRWLIISGERADVGVPGVSAAEVAMLAGVDQSGKSLYHPKDLPGETFHTILVLANPLAYRYRRDTLTIYGNVAEATHGATRKEVLGGGDSAVPFQHFQLHQSPLTYVATSVPSGVESTLEVRVNDVRWHPTEQLLEAGPRDHDYATRTDDDDIVTVVFGDGRHGARPPRGAGNISAKYRTGIGRSGNVPEGQITQLVTRPLGVNGVLNPVPATGGADRDSPASIRKNTPLVTMALDRLVSLQDYEYFAQTFAGIGKASALRLPHRGHQVVHLTVAGVDDIPISTTSELYRNLLQALRDFGDPLQTVEVAVRKLLLIVISAGVRLDPDYRWESVEPVIRQTLLDAFGFERRALGQPVWPGEVLAQMQSVPGVVSVDLDVLDSISQSITPSELASLAKNLRVRDPLRVHLARVAGRGIVPAELALLTPDIADTLILGELPA